MHIHRLLTKIFIPVLLFFVFIAAAPESVQNTFTISGTVTDTGGEPLSGVSVYVRDSATGTISDIDGSYSITLQRGSYVLLFSYIGYKTQEFTVDNSNTAFDVRLEENVQMLEEIVTVAYASQTRRMSTSSVSTISNVQMQTNSTKKSATWKRSGMPDNSIRLEVGDHDFIDMEAMQMAVQIDGFRVRVLIDCFFFNSKKDGLEGTFKLRLPNGASPCYFAFGETEYLDEDTESDAVQTKKRSRKSKTSGKRMPYVNYAATGFDLSPEDIGKNESRSWSSVKEARIVSKQKAARAYEQTVSAHIDPALMEWTGSDFFTCRVYPLSLNRLHRVVVAYDVNMTETLDFRKFTLVLPSGVKELQVDASVNASENMYPPVVKGIEWHTENERITFSLTNPDVKELTFVYDTLEPVMLIDRDSNYFASSYRIALPETAQEHLPSDAVFLFDLSLSSQPDRFNIWLKLMYEILTKNRDVIKQFAVVCFNIETFWWNTFYVKNNSWNITEFMKFTNTLAMEGATDLCTALTEASHPAWLKENTPKHIFMMSDADFNWGESSMQAIRAKVMTGDRIHTYKTGLSGTNSPMLDYLSRETGGFSLTVTGEEEAERTARSFRYRPWMIEEINVSGVEDFLVSGNPSQLYNGQRLIFAGRGIPEDSIHIRAGNGIETRDIWLTAKESIISPLTKRLYGQLALSTLENYGHYTEEATDSYSTYFMIPNATMSFLMLESESEYRRLGIDTDDAEAFVESHTVESILNELPDRNTAAALPTGKTTFTEWLKHLRDDTEISFDPDSTFWTYVQELPDGVFEPVNGRYTYRVRRAEQQTDEERTLLDGDDLRYDSMLKDASLRLKHYTAADALKLLSSVVEKNAGDFIALRDLAVKAIEWNLGEQAYSMMQRVIANREYEAVAYLTAANALAKAGHADMAIIYYMLCIYSDWGDEYGNLSEIAALQYLRFLDRIEKDNESVRRRIRSRSPLTVSAVAREYAVFSKPHTEQYLKTKELLIDEADIVIIISWNTNNTDIDLYVHEPGGEVCYYGNDRTASGGLLTMDVTEGYGPEMYVLKNAQAGQYRVTLDFFMDDATRTSSKPKVTLDFYRNFGRTDEVHTQKVIVMSEYDDEDMEYDDDDMEDYIDGMEVLQFNVRKMIE